MKIQYSIKEIKPKVFAVIVPDRYHRAMLFMRVQEYYESPNPKFRGKKNFNMWEYIEWYSRKHADSFTYASDWVGFNFPLEVALNCYDTLEDMYTPYDEIMSKIVWDIYEMNKDSERKAHGRLGAATLFGDWSPPEKAPKDGTQILGDFGYPWPQLAAWNTHDEKWATVSMMAQGMKKGTTDIWFETELEDSKQLKRWMPLPNVRDERPEAEQ